MSDLFARAAALARADVDFREAERLLRAEQARQATAPGGQRQQADKQDWADVLKESHYVARESRLRRWLGWDIAPPPEGDE